MRKEATEKGEALYFSPGWYSNLANEYSTPLENASLAKRFRRAFIDYTLWLSSCRFTDFLLFPTSWVYNKREINRKRRDCKSVHLREDFHFLANNIVQFTDCSAFFPSLSLSLFLRSFSPSVTSFRQSTRRNGREEEERLCMEKVHLSSIPGTHLWIETYRSL